MAGTQLQSRRAFLSGAAMSGVASLLAGRVAPRQYRLVRAKGTHRQLGLEHGEQAAEQIRAHVDYIAHTQKLSRAGLREKALRFKPLFDKHCPHLLEEIDGLAQGARIALAEALAVNIRGELGHARDEACTAYAVGGNGTSRGEVLIGQTSDMSKPNIDMGYVLHLKPQNKPQVLIWTFGGMIGYHGMNSAGVAHFANALGGGPQGRFGMPHYPVKRMMLECATMSEILELFERVPVASNANYMLCDGAGNILDIEVTTDGLKLLRDEGAGFLAHTNHFLCAPYATRENDEQSWPDSFPRLARINGMVKARFGSLTVEDVKKFLSDHSGYPTSICRHPPAGEDPQTASRTVAGIIAEPAQRRMHVALGNPCENPFVTHAMDS
ncbi:MAG TPA: C45 family peptidase [Bryobacteraceae bacterium]|nr:C45 family peptidase [Bryobacteraceae bacterium]